MTTYNVTFNGPCFNKSKAKSGADLKNKRNSMVDVENDKPAFIRRPRTLNCYICGREYGIASLQIHVKACIKRFEMEEALKPIGMRRPVP